MKRKLTKTIITYGAALALGLLLFALARPYAQSRRHDPSLLGGECLMPVYTVGAAFVIHTFRRDNNDETPES